MSVLDLYSRRKRQRLNAGKADVYRYDEIPSPLRHQIIDLWRWATGPIAVRTRFGDLARRDMSWNLWSEIEEALRHEKGRPALARGDDPFDRCAYYFCDSSTPIDDLLDVIEVTFSAFRSLAPLQDWQRRELEIKITPANAITELNFRLQDAGVGYQFEEDQIVELNSQYIHAEAVKPALALLSDARFAGPHEEFLHAHERYRKARADDDKALEDAIATAVKAFESTIKVICHLKGWTPPKNATAAPLVQFLIDKGLIPIYLKSSLDGLATLGNRTSRHGQGGQTREVAKHIAAYALNQAATNIVMLIETFKAAE